MEKKLQKIKERYQELQQQLSQDSILQDQQQYAQLNKEYKELAPILEQIHKKENQQETKQNQTFLTTETDLELLEMAKQERTELEAQAQTIETKLKELLLPKDPNDSKNIILEIRQGSGGQEATIWAKDLFRMYQRFSENKKWKLEILSYTESPPNGYKEIIASITGNNVYSHLKYESGIHRVQRIPETETQGRIHTSATSVVVLPEADTVEIDLNMNDIKKETFCSSGPGGQSVNTTYSAVRITHIPTGISVSCQDEKSQIKNLEKALKILRARLYERALNEQQTKIGQDRRTIISTGDRSAKIRTYNYPRITINDHRINYTQQNLPHVLNGNLDDLIQALQLADRTAQLTENKQKP